MPNQGEEEMEVEVEGKERRGTQEHKSLSPAPSGVEDYRERRRTVGPGWGCFPRGTYLPGSAWQREMELAAGQAYD